MNATNLVTRHSIAKWHFQRLIIIELLLLSHWAKNINNHSSCSKKHKIGIILRVTIHRSRCVVYLMSVFGRFFRSYSHQLHASTCSWWFLKIPWLALTPCQILRRCHQVPPTLIIDNSGALGGFWMSIGQNLSPIRDTLSYWAAVLVRHCPQPPSVLLWTPAPHRPLTVTRPLPCSTSLHYESSWWLETENNWPSRTILAASRGLATSKRRPRVRSRRSRSIAASQ